MQHVRSFAASAFVLVGLLAPSSALAADVQEGRFSVDPASVVELPLGVTDIDFNFDGKPGHAVSTYTDIASAHNNTQYLFATAKWKTILFEPGDNFTAPKGLDFPKIHDGFTTSQGADYRLRDIRLLRDEKAKKTYAVVAIRPYGNWVDSKPVTIELFTYTKLAPANQDPGMAPEYFQLTSWFTTQKCYPDADWAMLVELGLKLPLGEEHDAPAKSKMSQPCTKS